MTNIIDKIYVINIADATDRREFMDKQLKQYDIPYEFINAITPANNIVGDTLMYGINVREIFIKTIKSPSQIAISYSHLECCKRIIADNIRLGAIVEDDVRLTTDFTSKVLSYFQNTPDIQSHINTRPVIIYFTGLRSLNLAREVGALYDAKKAQYGNPFYLINKKMAHHLVNNFYPIERPFDDYVINICYKIPNIKIYYALPILCWDLSSHYYQRHWTPEDKELKFKRLSLASSINNFCVLKILQHHYSKPSSSYYNDILQTANITWNTSYDPSPYRYVIDHIDDNLLPGSIICTGLVNSSVNVNKIRNNITYINIVRGKLSYNILANAGVHVNPIYGDLLLLHSMTNLYNKPDKPVCDYLITDQLLYNKLHATYPDSNMLYKQDPSLDDILSCDTLITNNHINTVLAHSYGIPTMIITCDDFKLLDYLSGISYPDHLVYTPDQLINNLDDLTAYRPDEFIANMKIHILNRLMFTRPYDQPSVFNYVVNPDRCNILHHRFLRYAKICDNTTCVTYVFNRSYVNKMYMFEDLHINVTIPMSQLVFSSNHKLIILSSLPNSHIRVKYNNTFVPYDPERVYTLLSTEVSVYLDITPDMFINEEDLTMKIYNITITSTP